MIHCTFTCSCGETPRIVVAPDEGGARSQLAEAYESFAKSFSKLVVSEDHTPKMVIAFDEAQCLTTVQNTESLHDDKAEWSPSHMFCRVIAQLGSAMPLKAAIWVLFASTNSKLGDFSPPSPLRE